MLQRSNLHPYQLDIIERAKHSPNLGLFLDMGLGKSVTIGTILADSAPGKTLILAPLSVARNVWVQEFAKWEHLSHLRVARILGSEKERLAGMTTEADIYICNNENLVWLTQQDHPKFDYLVVDESSRYKEPSTKRWKALKKLLPTFKRRIIATGTPTPNSLSEIWAQVGILDMGERLEKSMTRFRDKYLEPEQKNRHTHVVYKWRLKPGAEEEIRGKIRDICVSMKAEDYLTLPDKTIINHSIELDKRAQTAYKALKKDMAIRLNGEVVTAVSAAALTNKLLQATSGVLYAEEGVSTVLHCNKLDYLDDLLADDTPSIIFYHFKSSLGRLTERFTDAKVLSDASILEWQQGTLKTLLVHPMSGGVGINLQNNYSHTANVIWYDLPWSSELYEQGIARVYRQGQSKPVVVHHLLAKDTIDNHVLNVLDKKITLQDALLDALKAN
jgi:SNF2 family DNA or RNA helicase